MLGLLLLLCPLLNLARTFFQCPWLPRRLSRSCHERSSASLKSIRRPTLRREEHGAIHQRELLRLEAESSVEQILLNLIEMKLQISTNQLLFLHSFEDKTLTNRLRTDNKIAAFIFNRKAFSCSKIKEIYFISQWVKVFHDGNFVTFVRSDINSIAPLAIGRIECGSDFIFPREHATDIPPQMLIAHRSKIAFA